ncbi:dehydrogenase [Persicimonas caeni]|uniref:Dehydrogenase n=1 Tax=Persicimonas caeni TaxID=2292766 RepID=A0A4Y6Q0I9_PERCE|nr:dehydrogenase E1 component subunit alpha/beta [Persicimonas caeni]QDG53757.1 dehydrogenase [Persicimonas caeni]QED34978.1 dehydrogenase [Persicimonas caeni]
MATNIEGSSADEIQAKANDGAGGEAKAPAGDGASTDKYGGLSPDELVQLFRDMYTSRKLDDAEINLKRQQKIYFQISGAGHEAALVGAAKAMKAGYDWFYPYYRDRALCVALGMTPLEVLAEAVGSSEDPNSGGRQMPAHWGHKDLNIVSQSSCTGTQELQAAGAAEVGRIMSQVDELKDKTDLYKDDEVVYVSIGDGASSEGEFWEAIGTASTYKLPVIFMVEDNGYAISVPSTEQVHGGSISKACAGFENLYITEYDGCDPIESYVEAKKAVEYARSGKGPALLHAHVIRPYSHSMSDDEKMYKPDAEREAEAAKDPIKTFPEFLVAEGILTEEGVEEVKAEVEQAVRDAVDEALELPTPHPDTVLDYVWSPDVDPTSDEFDVEPQWDEEGGEKTMVDLLNNTMRTEMRRDPRIVIFGEDVADVTKQELEGEVKGKGGVFKVTHGLQSEFGYRRVFNSPLAEANIIGRAIGMATRGLKPVVEIQFFDYIWPAYMQLKNELSNMRWRSNNAFSAPVVVRVPIGGYLKGGAPYHSQSGAVLFTHIPGLRVVMPSTAADAAGLLRTAIRCEDPVMFLEPKHLYRQTYNKSFNPGEDYTIPFGKAKTVREGNDLTIITYGSTVERSRRAVKKTGIDAEIIDLRSLQPYDWDAIANSVKKTNKALVVYEDGKSWGYGTEIATRIGDELFEYLDGPVKRVAAMDSFVAYHPDLEDRILPQIDDIAEAVEWLDKY